MVQMIFLSFNISPYCFFVSEEVSAFSTIIISTPSAYATGSGTPFAGKCIYLPIYLNMKRNMAFLCILLGLAAKSTFAQTKDAYVLPDTYHFDREVIQVMSDKKNAADSSRFYSYFTNSGEYAGLRMQGETTNHTGWVIVTRSGNITFFKERDKTATVISMRKIFSDLADLAKWIKMDSVMAGMRRRIDGEKARSVKTGK